MKLHEPHSNAHGYWKKIDLVDAGKLKNRRQFIST